MFLIHHHISFNLGADQNGPKMLYIAVFLKTNVFSEITPVNS